MERVGMARALTAITLVGLLVPEWLAALDRASSALSRRQSQEVA
jgi:ABC-type taurine transport system ATPase subunit